MTPPASPGSSQPLGLSGSEAMGAGTSIPERVLDRVCGSQRLERRDGFWPQLKHLLHADQVFFCLREECTRYVWRHGPERFAELLYNNPHTQHFQVRNAPCKEHRLSSSSAASSSSVAVGRR